MAAIRYNTGETIVLKARSLGGMQPQGAGRIVAVLPETRGAVCYRVRFANENFDRNIAEDDIDVSASSARDPQRQGTVSHETGTRWINSNSIKTRK